MDIQEGWELKLRWTGESCPKWEPYGTFADRWEQMCYNMKVSTLAAFRRLILLIIRGGN